MKYICYQDSFASHGWHVYWVYGWEMHRSEIIVFKNKLLLVSTYFTLLDAYIESSKVLSDSGLTWWLRGAASRLVSLSNYVALDVFFWFHEVERCLCRHFTHAGKIWDKDLSDLLQNLRHFLTATRRKTFWKIFSYPIGSKKEALGHILTLSSSLKKSKHGVAGLRLSKSWQEKMVNGHLLDLCSVVPSSNSRPRL